MPERNQYRISVSVNSWFRQEDFGFVCSLFESFSSKSYKLQAKFYQFYQIHQILLQILFPGENSSLVLLPFHLSSANFIGILSFLPLHHHIVCFGGFTESSFNFGQSSENCIKYCLISQGGMLTKSQLEENSETCLVLILIPKYEIQCYGSYAVSRIIQIDCMSANSEK